MSIFGKLVFFLSANSPVFFIWGIFQYEKYKFVSYTLFTIAILAYILMILLFKQSKKRQRKKLFDLKIKDNVNSKMMEYMVSYILPFISINNTDTIYTTIALLIYYIVLFGVYLRSDVFYVNPILNLVGYNIYKISYKENNCEKEAFLISKEQKYEINFEKNFAVIEENIFLSQWGN